MAKENKKRKQTDEQLYELNDFLIAEEDIVEELTNREKSKLESRKELDRMIMEQSTVPDRLSDKNKNLIPKSPHVLDIRTKKDNFYIPPTQEKDSAKLVRPQLNFAQYKNFFSLKRFIQYFREIFSFWKNIKIRPQYNILLTLSIVQLLNSFKQLLVDVSNILLSLFYYIFDLLKNIKWSLKDFLIRLRTAEGKAVNLALPRFKTNKGYRLAKLASFVVVALLIVVLPTVGADFYKQANNTKGKVLGISQSAVSQWQVGLNQISAGELELAQNSFAQAGSTFHKAKQQLEDFDSNLVSLVKIIPLAGDQIKTGENLIIIGEKLSSIISELSAALNVGIKNKKIDLFHKLTILRDKVNLAHEQYVEIQPLIKDINVKYLPSEYQPIFRTWQNNNETIEDSLYELKRTLDWLLLVLGSDSPKRYLLMFQNSNELRATGGFMGSYAQIDLEKGKIINLEVPSGGTYDLKGQQKEFVIGPYPHHLLGVRWNIWDANWWPDWPRTAEKISWFYENAGGPTVDGVIAINSSVFASLLELIGPVDLESYEKTLTSDTAILALQHTIEFEYDKEKNQPKQIITDLAPIIIERMFNLSAEQIIELGGIISSHLKQRDIQLHFSSPELNQYALEHNWTGKVIDAKQDYLMVVAQNIGGGKSDAVVSQNVNYEVVLGPDNYLIGKVNVTRTHNGDENDVFTRHRNVSFIRVYVPKGSELISIDGAIEPDQKMFKEVLPNFEADKDLIALEGLNYYTPFTKYYSTTQFNKEVFGQWLMIDPGETKQLSFVYRLPISVEQEPEQSDANWWQKLFIDEPKFKYQLVWQKQPGLAEEKYSFNWQVKGKYDIKWFGDNKKKLQQLGTWIYGDDTNSSTWVSGIVID